MPMRDSFDGAIVQGAGDLFGEKVYYVSDGRRHWIPDGEWFTYTPHTFPDDVNKIPDLVLSCFLPAGYAPRPWSIHDFSSPPRNSSCTMREIMVSQLTGKGVEIGASASPLPIPLHCKVLYADREDSAEIGARYYPGQNLIDMVPIDIHTSLEELKGIPDESIDFLIACHVIEHTSNPIEAIKQAYSRLVRGGHLVLIVPDKERTFDKERDLTELAHLIEDFRNPSREMDKLHYQEFHKKAFKCPPNEFENVWKRNWEQRSDIHYHTWTYESFAQMLAWVRDHVAPFSTVWSQKTLPNTEHDIEFYYVLTK